MSTFSGAPQIHDDIIENTGDAFGILNKGLIEFTIERVKGEVIKEEDTDLFEVASLILRDFVQGHPFVDGNKRIAFELVDILLRDNGYIFKIEKEEVIKFLLQLAKGESGLKEVKEWIKKKVKSK
ncbi:MAG: type II toxin-antitoxin system death-on-curing family toxin [Methanophagales archaeon]|nr:type II toxin-antitoxin system death-on-curing family toxin [Methanophagales archaeon]